MKNEPRYFNCVVAGYPDSDTARLRGEAKSCKRFDVRRLLLYAGLSHELIA
jgi:hypothetical protein